MGKALVERLVETCRAKGITWIALVAEPDTCDFYAGMGFTVMDGHIPMLYRGGDTAC